MISKAVDKKRGHDHSATGRSLKSVVYGGLDGIITTFAVVAGVAGASLSANIVLILGFANLIGDGISMAVGDYLSSKSENEYYHKEKMHYLESTSPINNAIKTFLSFIFFGLIPLLAYVFQAVLKINFNVFLIATILTGFALFFLGSLKSRFTGKSLLGSGFETLLVGSLAAGAAYLVGYFI